MLPNDKYTVCEPIYSWRRTIVPRENVPFMAARNDQYLFPGEGGSMLLSDDYIEDDKYLRAPPRKHGKLIISHDGTFSSR